MVSYVDAQGKPIKQPPHGPDPRILTISTLRGWSQDIFLFSYKDSFGGGYRTAQCQATWINERATWQFFCNQERYVVF